MGAALIVDCDMHVMFLQQEIDKISCVQHYNLQFKSLLFTPFEIHSLLSFVYIKGIRVQVALHGNLYKESLCAQVSSLCFQKTLPKNMVMERILHLDIILNQITQVIPMSRVFRRLLFTIDWLHSQSQVSLVYFH